MEIFSSHAKDYIIYPKGKPEEPFKFVSEPVFRHDAPSRNADDIGGVWVWVDDSGRPAVVGTVFGWTSGPNQRSVLHEFHTLSRQPIEGAWRSRDHWRPQETMTYKPIPDAPIPHERARARHLQMRQIARRFSAYTIDRRDQRWQLRLVPAPVYQWDVEAPSDHLGGAVFVICQDTNTDVVLCIEAVRADDEARFVYACGSFADWEARVELDGKEVWMAERSGIGPRGTDSPHWVRRVAPERLPAIP